MKNINLNDIILVLGAAGVAYGIYANHRMQKVSERLDKSVEQLSGSMEIDISDALINEAVDKAVDREVSSGVTSATNKAIKSIESDIHKEVKDAVRAHYDDLKADVSKEMRKQVANIDIQELRKEVVREAKERAAEKFNENLDGILEKFNGELDSVSKIYRSISNSITGSNTGKEMRFTIS